MCRSSALLVASALFAAGCPQPIPPAPVSTGLFGDLYGEPAARLVLIGDAGDLGRASHVLPYLVHELDRMPMRTGLVFLGDNAYALGLPAGCQLPDCEEARALDLQLDLAAHAPGLQLFVPGNHDWGDRGYLPLPAEEGVRRLERAADAISARGAEMLPNPSCPGPAVRELAGGALRVVAIDSQWWLLSAEERADAAWRGPCEGMDEATMLLALDAALSCTNRPCTPTVVVAHHPLVTYGPHGGEFSWYRHLTPPLFGSLYLWLRQSGVTRQDVSSEAYQHYVREVGAVIDRHAPIAFAAGHEHAQQVIHVLDGLGTAHLTTAIGTSSSPVFDGPGTRFARSEPGAIVLDVFAPDRILLRVMEVSGSPRAAHEVHHRWLRRP